MNFDLAMNLVHKEYDRAVATNKPFASCWEGYAVLEEEFEELKAEVFKSPKKRDMARIREELVQVAAMGVRYIADIGGVPMDAVLREVGNTHVRIVSVRKRPLNSFHEGYGYLRAAMGCLWTAIEDGKPITAQIGWAYNVSARAVEMLADLCEEAA